MDCLWRVGVESTGWVFEVVMSWLVSLVGMDTADVIRRR